MAVLSSKAVYICLLEMAKEIDYDSDTFKVALMNDTFSFDPDKHKAWDATAWAATTAYSVGDVCKPTVENGYLYRCTSAGTSDSGEPTWPTPEDSSGADWGDEVVDDGATWELWSYNTSEDEITQENGYTGPETLGTGSSDGLAEDEANNQAEYTSSDITITATGSVGPTGAACIYNDTHAQKPVDGVIDFGEDHTLSSGQPITLSGIKIQNVAQQDVSV